MYSEIKVLNNINGCQIVSNKLYTFCNDKKILGEFTLEGKELWTTKPSNIYYRYNVCSELILYYEDKKSKELKILDRETKYVLKIDNIDLNISDEDCYYDNKLISFGDDDVIIYNLSSFSVDKIIDDYFEGYLVLITDNYLINIDDAIILLYNKHNYLLHLKKDLKKYYTPTDEIEIEEVYLYKEDFLIVVGGEGIIKLKLETGELIWKTDDYALTMEIVDNFGYVCTGLSLYRINLDTGEIYDYNREYARLPDFEYGGKSYWPSGHRVVYHNGLLWYAVYASGDSFIIAINPEDGNYQWIHKVDTYEKIENIQFHQDKMFVSDTGSNLFIYKETE